MEKPPIISEHAKASSAYALWWNTVMQLACAFVFMVIMLGVLLADVNKRDGVTISTTINADGSTATLDKADGQTIAEAGGMASIAFSKSNAVQSSGSDTTIAATISDVVAGSFVQAEVGYFGADTTIAVSDGAALTSAAKKTFSTDEWATEIFYKQSSAGGSVTWTATFGAARAFRSIKVRTFTYTGTITLDDVSDNESVGGTSDYTTGNITTTAAVNLAVLLYANGSFATLTSPQINGSAVTHEITSDLIHSGILISGATFTGQGTGASSVGAWSGQIVSWKVVP